MFISSFVCNSQTLETTQMPINRWVNKQTVIDPYNEILLIKRNKLLITCSNTDITWNNYMKLCERRETQKSTYNMIPFMQASRKCRLMHSNKKHISCCMGMRVEEGGVYRGDKESCGSDADVRAPTRDWTCTLSSESTESYPLGCQGIPWLFVILTVVMVSWVNTRIKSYPIVYSEHMQFMVC